ncbi:hypothetical protein PMIN04_003231 [Paraphaeosphaeria minitans]
MGRVVWAPLRDGITGHGLGVLEGWENVEDGGSLWQMKHTGHGCRTPGQWCQALDWRPPSTSMLRPTKNESRTTKKEKKESRTTRKETKKASRSGPAISTAAPWRRRHSFRTLHLRIGTMAPA